MPTRDTPWRSVGPACISSDSVPVSGEWLGTETYTECRGGALCGTWDPAKVLGSDQTAGAVWTMAYDITYQWVVSRA